MVYITRSPKKSALLRPWLLSVIRNTKRASKHSAQDFLRLYRPALAFCTLHIRQILGGNKELVRRLVLLFLFTDTTTLPAAYIPSKYALLLAAAASLYRL